MLRREKTATKVPKLRRETMRISRFGIIKNSSTFQLSTHILTLKVMAGKNKKKK
ncbi:MAG: hypothetical protein ACJAT2_001435 [Bacteriovoracaceae bacterium]|jgi:hypothetical protein